MTLRMEISISSRSVHARTALTRSIASPAPSPSRHSCKLGLRKCQILSRGDPLLCLMVMLVMMKRHARPAGR